MNKIRAYVVGDQVLFRHQKAVKTGTLKAIVPNLDRRGRINTRVTITTIYRDMGDNAHTLDIPGVRYSAIVGLQESEVAP